MSKSKITDFNVGDDVYHKSNNKLTMVVVQVHPELNEVTCRWVDTKGQTQKDTFLPEELAKIEGFSSPIFLG